jgi:3-deoxy-D-manno-octulosonic-acid transferase
MHYYLGLSDLAFVGGSLVNTGCQNIIEPAAMGLPVITGPSRFNFQAVSDGLVAAGGQQIVADADELATTVNALLADPARRHAMGDAAARAVQANQGATARNLGIINRLLEAPPVADASAG